tara:strand:+ start:222 stop:425 length:204 start_codon:yes stop_codon:yes gene_type:complete
MEIIKTVKNEKTNKVYRVRKINNLNHYIVDTFETRLDAAKRECEGYYYVTCADSKQELNSTLTFLTK